MNRFRKHKKEKVKETPEEVESTPAPSVPAFNLKPKKKDSPEPPPQLDLSAVLPPTDNFRTSLLMPKLSARFSMLREQDDPESKIGKASDDSVLFPKRASRLNLFGHNPSTLADIDEVSIDGSRPSIALGRTDSYASGGDGGDGADDDRSQNGSIMSRARRADGNNLFGGRQKVYRIPVRSPGGTSPSTETGRGMGKAVYEHDLNLSAFQRWRNKEREERTAEEAGRDSNAHEFEDSRSTISSAQRTTSSSTASGPAPYARTSTAATSIDESQFDTSQSQSQVPNGAAELQVDVRPPSALSAQKNAPVRSRRLYGQGLTQAAQNQQHSTLNRLETLNRQRAGTPDQLMNRNYSRSASNLRDRLQNLNITESTTASRPTSPPSSATSPTHQLTTECAPKERTSPTATGFGSAPHLSPAFSENEDAHSLLAAALSPEDHGKATAMGLFNRPATGFDEQAFARRQLQMQQGRNTPPLRRPSPPRRPLPQEPVGRPRGLSKSSYRSRAESASSYYSSDANHGIDHSRVSSVEFSPGQPGARTFYANSTGSDSGDEGEDRGSYELSSVTSLTTDYGHSLYHSSFKSEPPTPTGDHLETLPEVRYSDLGDLKPIEENDGADDAQITQNGRDTSPERPDSPILHGTGLSGIRSHLRTASDKSSIYPLPSPGLPPQSFHATKFGTHETITEHSPTSPMSDASHERENAATIEQYHPPSPQSFLRQSSDLGGSRGSDGSSGSTAFPGYGLHCHDESWKDDFANHHRRDGSTETQKEREEFAIELAERRQKVQEKLRSVAESESRSGSPAPGRSTPDIKAGNAFALLKHKSSNQSVPKPDHKNSSLYDSNNASLPALGSDDSGHDEERPFFSFGRHSNSSSPHVSERSLRSRMPRFSRTGREESREPSRSRNASPAGPHKLRDRTGSDASASRSKSRGRYRERDDLETVDEGNVIAHEKFVIPDNFEPPVPGSTRPSMEVEPLYVDRPDSAASGRYRSTSRPGTASQYELPFHPPSMIGAPPRPSPAAPAYSANTTPPLNEDQSPQESAGANSHALPQRASGHPMFQKRSIKKKLISEPTFVSCTSNVPTVGLPSGPSPGGSATPPVAPPMNPRRRRGTQTILNVFKGDKHESVLVASAAATDIADEHSVFPDDEKRSRSRSRLRKTSSDGGGLGSRARQDAMASPPPALPQYPPPAIPVDGGMF